MNRMLDRWSRKAWSNDVVDSEEETKILEDFFHAIGFSVELDSFNDLIQNLPEALNTEDFPPPEQSPLV